MNGPRRGRNPTRVASESQRTTPPHVDPLKSRLSPPPPKPSFFSLLRSAVPRLRRRIRGSDLGFTAAHQAPPRLDLLLLLLRASGGRLLPDPPRLLSFVSLVFVLRLADLVRWRFPNGYGPIWWFYPWICDDSVESLVLLAVLDSELVLPVEVLAFAFV